MEHFDDFEEAVEYLIEDIDPEFEYNDINVEITTYVQTDIDDVEELEGHVKDWTYDASEIDYDEFTEIVLKAIRELVKHEELTIADIELFINNEDEMRKLHDLLADYFEDYAIEDCKKNAKDYDCVEYDYDDYYSSDSDDYKD